MQRSVSLVVYTDLDGTLLDHETYSWAPAGPALARLADLDVPVVLASSKTAAEIRKVQIDMNLAAVPAIVENGAGVLEPDETGQQDTRDYDRLRQALEQLPQDLRVSFVGFGDMTDREVAQLTGLSEADAALARDRQFSEPGLWTGDARHRLLFLSALSERGITSREGGRFLTLSFGRTKQDRMSEIAVRFAPELTIALGDAPNDVEMLNHADFGVIIANPHREPLPALPGEATGQIRRMQEPGPAGWNRAIHDFLDRFGTLKGEPTLG